MTATYQHKDWKFGQCFGEKDNEEEFAEVDVLSAVRFDESGDYLATGDKGGRIVIFERTAKGVPPPKRKRRWIEERDDGDGPGGMGRRGSSSSLGGSGSSAVDSVSAAFSRTSMGLAGSGAGDDSDAPYDDPHERPGGGGRLTGPAEYRFLSEFQSHEAEFDYLKSLEIEEKINQIAWCKRVNQSLFLLSTNDKTIKLWKVSERRPKTVADYNVTTGPYGGALAPSSLKIPRVMSGEPQMFAFPRRVYSSAHAYHINSIAANSDGETFLSADDLRINLWNLENAKLSFNIVDIKPPTLEELTEVITSAEFHPSHCHLFVYASSRGTVKLGDMRSSALCDRHAKSFEEPEDPSGKTYFSEMIASVSDLEFTRDDGRYIVSRDYLSIKVWDINMEARPLKVIPVHEFLRPKLVELYESDCIFDKFEVSTGGRDGTSVMTGSYSNCFKVYDTALGSETTIELAKGKPKPPAVRPVMGGAGMPVYDPASQTSFLSSSSSSSSSSSPFDVNEVTMADSSHPHHHHHHQQQPPKAIPISYDHSLPPIDPDEVDFGKKVLHFSWHPNEDIVAVAGLNNLYIYHI